MLRCLFPRWETTAKKPKIKEIPEVLTTVGDHIKKRRLELGMFQKDVAAMFSVCEATIGGWETGSTKHPFIEHAPDIISFLGYNPFLFETETLGGQIKYHRLLNGINLKAFSQSLGIDKSTLFSWESNEHIPQPLMLKRLKSIILTLKSP